MLREKRKVALSSVFAAVFLTAIKLIVGVLTGSLGILSEALHSALDLIAALTTFFAVKIADKPADTDHHYGHGKIENLSALFETLLLIITCFWIMYEAFERLSTGATHFEISFWGFAVVIVSIVVDIFRSRALMRVAKKYKSQALEADALHFSTDIASSSVVLIGLTGASFGFFKADSLAAVVVALIVLHVSYKLGRRSVDDLLDKSPGIDIGSITELANRVSGITQVHNVRIRPSGSQIFIELNIHVASNITIKDAHSIAHEYEALIKNAYERSNIHIHIEPEK